MQHQSVLSVHVFIKGKATAEGVCVLRPIQSSPSTPLSKTCRAADYAPVCQGKHKAWVWGLNSLVWRGDSGSHITRVSARAAAANLAKTTHRGRPLGSSCPAR